MFSIQSSNRSKSFVCSISIVLLGVVGQVQPSFALAPVIIGPYSVSVSTQPAVVPVGSADVILKITDPNGKPVKDADVRAIAKMPGMPMGEREQVAVPQSEAGVYKASATFPMRGSYEIGITITSEGKTAQGMAELVTGQDTSIGGTGFPTIPVLLIVLVVCLAVFTLYRMNKTGQRVERDKLLTRPVVTGLLILVVGLVVATYVVRTQRREGAMTPLEAQGMEMNTPAPPRATPVELTTVTHRTIESTVNYFGQAVGYVELDVAPRVTGILTWMPYYAGDRVKAGQLLAKLDTTQADPLVAERRAAAVMAVQDSGIAGGELTQSERAVDEAESAYVGARGAVDEARASLDAARQDRDNMDAEVLAAQSSVEDANAQIQGSQADQDYWRGQIGRTRELLKAGVISGEEFKRDQAQATNADAKVRQTQAALDRAKSEVKSKQAAVRRADAMIRAAESKMRQSQSAAEAAQARIRSAQAGVSVAHRKVSRANAGAAQGRAFVTAATATQGYSRLAAQTEGVITQRLISPGSLVNPGQPILRVAKISPVRIQVNVPESDVANMNVGGKMVIRGQGRAGNPVQAKITSIAPSVDPAARTAVVEALIANTDGRFVPGSYVSVDIATGEHRNSLAIASDAIHQTNTVRAESGATTQSAYVWAAEASGSAKQYTVHRVTVTTGLASADYTEILSGLRDGQQVVTQGGEYLKEGGQAVASSSPESVAPGHHHAGMAEMDARKAQTATVEVFTTEYSPAVLNLKAGIPADITFIRRADKTCGGTVVFPDYGIKKTLPMNTPTTVHITPRKGEFRFTCAMNMFAGKLVVR